MKGISYSLLAGEMFSLIAIPAKAAITRLPMPNTGMPHILSFQKSACHYYGKYMAA